MIQQSILTLLSLFVIVPISWAINNPLIELSSREELAKIAGYGEEKLSTVFLHGTLLCGHTPHPVQGLISTFSSSSNFSITTSIVHLFRYFLFAFTT